MEPRRPPKLREQFRAERGRCTVGAAGAAKDQEHTPNEPAQYNRK